MRTHRLLILAISISFAGLSAVYAADAETGAAKKPSAKSSAASAQTTSEKADTPVTTTPASQASATTTAPAESTTHAAPSEVAPDQALTLLQNGNARFANGKLRKDRHAAADRKRLLAGQHPHTIVLSCADSRVPPETVFDQGLGDIFTIRVAGEALDTSVIASVEYAVEHLGSRLLVVMGHTQCGAVDAAIKVKEGDSAGSEALDKLLADIRPRLKSVVADKVSASLEVESELNAEGVARDIVARSELIRKKVEVGELVIKAALYRMDSGKVSFH